MNLFKSIILLGILSSSVSAIAANTTSSYGGDTDYCGNFVIQISNVTGKTCVLKRYNTLHGNIVGYSTIPQTLLQGATKSLTMTQYYFGPDIIMEYSCGDKMRIRFESQQNLCAIMGGGITGTVLQALNMTAMYTEEQSSRFYGTPGYINWSLMPG